MVAQTKHYLKLHFIILIWGFTAILGLYISIPAVEMVFYRTLIATLALAVLLATRHKSFRLEKKSLLGILATGGIIAAHWILFFAAARVANASVCLAGMATCSLWTSFLSPLFTRSKIKPYEVGLGLLVIVGLYVIFRFEFDHALGLLLAIASALLAAIFTIINAKLVVRHDPYTITFYEMAGACLSTLLFFPVYLKFLSKDRILHLAPTLSDWGYLLILSLACTVYAYSVSVDLMKYVTAFAMTLTNNLEPVYGIVLAALLLNEYQGLSVQFYLGTGIILLSVLAYPVIQRYLRRRTLAEMTG